MVTKQWHLEVGPQAPLGGVVTAACGMSWSPSLWDPVQRTDDVGIEEPAIDVRCPTCQTIYERGGTQL